jgi:hypothetical protein
VGRPAESQGVQHRRGRRERVRVRVRGRLNHRGSSTEGAGGKRVIIRRQMMLEEIYGA